MSSVVWAIRPNAGSNCNFKQLYMSVRKVIDAEMKGEKVYFKSHAKATFLSDGRNVEDSLEAVKPHLYFTEKRAGDWVASSHETYRYSCDIACDGVTAKDYAKVVFDIAEATSGDYAPICETGAGFVRIWSKRNESIVIPTIIVLQS